MSRTAFQDSTDGSIHSNSAPVLRGGDVVDGGGKFALLAVAVAVVALVVAILAHGDSQSVRELSEARYADLVARTAASADVARRAERESRLQRLETDEMNVRLELAKIPRHQSGDKP